MEVFVLAKEKKTTATAASAEKTTPKKSKKTVAKEAIEAPVKNETAVEAAGVRERLHIQTCKGS